MDIYKTVTTTKIVKPVTRQQTIRVNSQVSKTKAPSNTDAIMSQLKTAQQKTRQKQPILKTLEGLYKQTNSILKPKTTVPLQMQEQEFQKVQVNGMTTINGGNAANMLASMPVQPALNLGSPIPVGSASGLLGVRTAKNPFYPGGAGSLSPSEMAEMEGYLQRYIAEGAARGVDVVAMIRNLPGGQLKVGIADWSGSGIGVGGTGVGSLFERDWWNKTSVGKRMGLFFQEISHGLGLMEDSQNPAFGWERGWMHGAVDATNASVYTKNFDMLFEDMRKYNKKTITGAASGMPGTAPASAAGDPNAYNDLMNGLAAGMGMGANGQPIPGAAPIINNTYMPPTITPPNPITTMQPGQNGTGMTNISPDQSSRTTLGIDGMTPYDGGSSGQTGGLDSNLEQFTHTFESDLAEIPASTGPMLQGLAGALL